MLIIEATLLDYTPDLPADKAAPDAPILEVHDRALLNVAAWADGGRNWWRAYSYLQGNSSAVVLLKQAPGGPAVPVATVAPPVGFKIDSATATQNGDGPDIVVTMTVHAISSDPARAVQLADAVVPGLAVPRTPEARDGLAAPFAPGPPPEPTPSEPVDYARIGVMMQGQMDRLIGLFGGTSVRSGIQEKVEDALVRLMDKEATPPDPRSARYLDLLAPFIRDRAYEALHPQEEPGA